MEEYSQNQSNENLLNIFLKLKNWNKFLWIKKIIKDKNKSCLEMKDYINYHLIKEIIITYI